MLKYLFTLLVAVLISSLSHGQNFYKEIIQVDSARYHQSVMELLKSQAVTEAGPDDMDVHYKNGVNLLEQGKFEEAVVQFRKSIRLYQQMVGTSSKLRPPRQRNPYPYLLTGKAKAQLNEWDSAIYFYRQAIAEAPYLVEPQLELGNAFALTEQYDSAISAYEKAEAIDPNSREVLYNLGYAFFITGENRKSEKYIQRAIQSDSSFLQPHLLFGQMKHIQGKPKEALKSLNRAIEIDPSYVHAYYLRAEVYFQTKELELAYADLLIIKEADPSNMMVMIMLSAIDFVLERFDNAFVYLNKALSTLEQTPGYFSKIDYKYLEIQSLTKEYLRQSDPEVKQMLLQFIKKEAFPLIPELAEAKAPTSSSLVPKRINLFYLVANEEWPEVIEVASAINAIDSSIFTVNYILGRAFAATGDHLAAKKYLTKAVALNAGHGPTHFYLGEANYGLKLYQEGLGNLNVSLELNPNHPESYNLRGILKERLADREGALLDYRKCLSYGTIDDWALNNIGNVYLSRRQYDSAIVYLNRAKEFDSQGSYPYFNLGRVYQYQGVYDKALENFNKSIELDDQVPAAFRFRGDFYYFRRNYEAAIADYTRAVELEQNAEIFGLRGDAYYAMGKFAAARDDFQRLVELKPDLPIGHVRLADAFYKLDQYEEAKQFYLKAISQKPDMSIAYGNLGWVCYLNKQFEECIKYSLQAVEYDDEAFYAMYNIALAKLRLGLFEEAATLYKQYTASDKEVNSTLSPGAIADLQELVDANIYAEQASQILKEFFNVEQ